MQVIMDQEKTVQGNADIEIGPINTSSASKNIKKPVDQRPSSDSAMLDDSEEIDGESTALLGNVQACFCSY